MRDMVRYAVAEGAVTVPRGEAGVVQAPPGKTWLFGKVQLASSDGGALLPLDQLPPNAREILRYRRVGEDGAISVGIPDGYVAEPARNGKGTVFRKPGTTDNANTIRLMEASPYTPYPYMRVYNAAGQPISPYDGRPGSNNDTHFPINNISRGD